MEFPDRSVPGFANIVAAPLTLHLGINMAATTSVMTAGESQRW